MRKDSKKEVGKGICCVNDTSIKHVMWCDVVWSGVMWCDVVCVCVCVNVIELAFALTSSMSWTRAGGTSGTHCNRWWWFPGSTWSEHRGPARRNTVSPGTKLLEHHHSVCPSDTKWLTGLFSGNSQMTEAEILHVLREHGSHESGVHSSWKSGHLNVD